MLRIREAHGPAAILDCSRTGSLSMLHSRSTVKRLLYMFGGCTELWTNISAEAEVFAVRQTYGAKADYKSAGREPTDYENSRLIVMWGWSPADGTFGTGTLQYLKRAKQRGVKIICVDPRRTRTSWELADQHVFINPATDTAALIAMAHVILTEGLHDQAYLDRHVLGFDEAHLPPGAPAGASYRSYLLGEADGVPKTPGVGGRDHRRARGDPARPRDRVRDRQARRAPDRLRARAARSTASSSTARPTRSAR